MTEPRSTLLPQYERSTSTTRDVATTGTVDSRFVAQMLELESDKRMLTADLEAYRDTPSTDFVDLDDIAD